MQVHTTKGRADVHLQDAGESNPRENHTATFVSWKNRAGLIAASSQLPRPRADRHIGDDQVPTCSAALSSSTRLT